MATPRSADHAAAVLSRQRRTEKHGSTEDLRRQLYVACLDMRIVRKISRCGLAGLRVWYKANHAMRSRFQLNVAFACSWSDLSGYILRICSNRGKGTSEGDRRSAVEPRVLLLRERSR